MNGKEISAKRIELPAVMIENGIKLKCIACAAKLPKNLESDTTYGNNRELTCHKIMHARCTLHSLTEVLKQLSVQVFQFLQCDL